LPRFFVCFRSFTPLTALLELCETAAVDLISIDCAARGNWASLTYNNVAKVGVSAFVRTFLDTSKGY
jgi:hypothetical protein